MNANDEHPTDTPRPAPCGQGDAPLRPQTERTLRELLHVQARSTLAPPASTAPTDTDVEVANLASALVAPDATMGRNPLLNLQDYQDLSTPEEEREDFPDYDYLDASDRLDEEFDLLAPPIQPPTNRRFVAAVAVLLLAAIVAACIGLSSLFNIREGITASSTTLADANTGAITYASTYKDGSHEAQLYDLCTTALEHEGVASLGGIALEERDGTALRAALDDALNDDPACVTFFPEGVADVEANDNTDAEAGVDLNVSGNTLRVGGHLYPADRQPAKDVTAVRQAAQAIHERALEASGGRAIDYVASCYAQIGTAAIYPSRTAENHWFANNPYGALLEGQSQCYGLSCALKTCLDLGGIPNFIAVGTTKQGGHAWNVVYLDRGWYVCDLTMAVSNRTDSAYTVDTMTESLLSRSTAKSSSLGFMIAQGTYLGSQVTVRGATTIKFEDIEMSAHSLAVEKAYERSQGLIS